MDDLTWDERQGNSNMITNSLKTDMRMNSGTSKLDKPLNRIKKELDAGGSITHRNSRIRMCGLLFLNELNGRYMERQYG